jgi:predicted dehydrogenase
MMRGQGRLLREADDARARRRARDARDGVMANPDVICQVGTQKIMLPKYIAAKRLIEEGAIGVPTFSQTSRTAATTPTASGTTTASNPDWKPGENLDWKAWLGDKQIRDWDPT